MVSPFGAPQHDPERTNDGESTDGLGVPSVPPQSQEHSPPPSLDPLLRASSHSFLGKESRSSLPKTFQLDRFTPRLPLAWEAQHPPGWTPLKQVSGDRLVPENLERVLEMVENLHGHTSDLYAERSKYLLTVLAIKLSNQEIWDELVCCAERLLEQPGVHHNHLAALIEVVARACRNELTFETCSALLTKINEYHKPVVAMERLEFFHALLNSFIPPSNVQGLPSPEQVRCSHAAWSAAVNRRPGTAILGIDAFSDAIKAIEKNRLLTGATITPFAPTDWRAFHSLVKVGRQILGTLPPRDDSPIHRLIDGTVLDAILAFAFRDDPRLLAHGRLFGVSYATHLLRQVLTEIGEAPELTPEMKLSILKEKAFIEKRESLVERATLAKHLGVQSSWLPITAGRMPVETANIYATLLSPHSNLPKESYKKVASEIADILESIQHEIPKKFQQPTFDLLIQLNSDVTKWTDIAYPIIRYIHTNTLRDDVFPLRVAERLPAILNVAEIEGANLPEFLSTGILFAESSFALTKMLALTGVAAELKLKFSQISRNPREAKLEKLKHELLIETYLKIIQRHLPLKENVETLHAIATFSRTPEAAESLYGVVLEQIENGKSLVFNSSPFVTYIEEVLPLRDLQDLLNLHKRLMVLQQIPNDLLSGAPHPSVVARDLARAIVPIHQEHPYTLLRDQNDFIAGNDITELVRAWFKGAHTYEEVAERITSFTEIATNFSGERSIYEFASPGATSERYSKIISNIRHHHSADPFWPEKNKDTGLLDTPHSVLSDVQQVWHNSFLITRGFRSLMWSCRKPVGGHGTEGQKLLENFCKYASVTPSAIVPDTRSDGYPGVGFVYEMLDLPKLLRPIGDTPSIREAYKSRWLGLGDQIDHSEFSTIIECQGFISIIPPADPSEGAKAYTIDGVPYGALHINNHFYNPIRLGSLLAPVSALQAMWIRTPHGYRIRPDITDSAALLRFLRDYSNAPVFILTSGVNISGFHKAYPAESSLHYLWEKNVFNNSLHVQPDSAGHIQLTSTVTSLFQSIELNALVPPDFLRKIPQLHNSIVEVARNTTNIYNTLTLCRSRWINGMLPQDVEGAPDEFSILRSAYQWHNQQAYGELDPSNFPVYAVVPNFGSRFKYSPKITLDTYSMEIETPIGIFPLPKNSDGNGVEEQKIWRALIGSEVEMDDNLVILPLDRQDV